VNKVCFSGSLAQSVNRDDFILFRMVGTDSDKIVSFRMFKLCMSDISLEFHINSEPFLKLFAILLIEIPLVSIIS